MNEYERLRRLAQRHRESYPPCLKIEIPAPLAELLLLQAAEQEIPVEDIVTRAIKNYMKGRGHNAR